MAKRKSESTKKYYTVTRLGQLPEVSATAGQINAQLLALGYQTRTESWEDRWAPTEKGAALCQKRKSGYDAKAWLVWDVEAIVPVLAKTVAAVKRSEFDSLKEEVRGLRLAIAAMDDALAALQSGEPSAMPFGPSGAEMDEPEPFSALEDGDPDGSEEFGHALGDLDPEDVRAY
jgi:hypothetical protein